MMEHELKCWSDPFEAMRLNQKRHEFRKNDRNFQVGDVLLLRECKPCRHCAGTGLRAAVGPDVCEACLDSPKVRYTNRSIRRVVSYIATAGYGIPAGYCVMSVYDPEPTVTDLEADEFCNGLDNSGRACTTVDDIRDMLKRFLQLRNTDPDREEEFKKDANLGTIERGSTPA